MTQPIEMTLAQRNVFDGLTPVQKHLVEKAYRKGLKVELPGGRTFDFRKTAAAEPDMLTEAEREHLRQKAEEAHAYAQKALKGINRGTKL